MNSIYITIVLLSSITAAKCSQLRAAPFFMPLDNDPPDVVQAMNISGVKNFVLAFVLAPNSGGCVPTWNGNILLKVSEDTVVLDKVKAVREAGGDVSISFGGYNGMELANEKACPDVQQLANAYQLVIDKYELTNIDLDIEGDNLGEEVSETRRFKAIKILKDTAKAKGKELFVTLTLPATTVGLSDLGRAEIRRGVEDGVVIDLYKVMAFDYGGPGPDMASNVIKVMELAHQQIKELRVDLDETQVYETTGIILMNGHTDQSSELFNFETFETVVDYANSKRLGRMSFWALNRDRECDPKVVDWVSGVCSSLKQQPFDFSKILAKFDPKNQTIGTTQEPTGGPTLNYTTPVPSTERVTFSPIIDDIDCRKESDNTMFEYKEDIHKYILCYNKLAHLEDCPKGTVFDPKLRICNWPLVSDQLLDFD